MRYNFIYFPRKDEPSRKSDDLCITDEIRELISQFQDENLPLATREKTFYKIIKLTKQLIS
ncbi:hypothetical protein SAMN05192559_12014 [Halobacillus karajensis]|nr:hypothetical protein SAMN05192559_12014 [Halobacillus karajensis]